MGRPLLLACVLVACGSDPEPAREAEAELAAGSEAASTGALGEDAFAELHEHRSDAAPELRGETVSLADGTQAYLSLPEGAGPHPGVLVIHEWWGLNDHIRHWADRLATAGYAALAVDLYGGQTATESERAMELMKAVEEDAAIGTIRAGRGFLETDLRVQAPCTGIIGWCFGGGMALKGALALPSLDAVVMYYGHVVEEPDRLESIDAPLLGIFANEDTSITPEKVDAFDEALDEADVDHRILRFDADHAFANPSSARYDHENATEAWRAVQSFFAEHLKGAG